MASKIAYSCVVDDTPKLFWEAMVWAAALREICGIPPGHIFFHVVEGVGADACAALEVAHCNIVRVAPFHEAHPPSNKLQQLDAGRFSSFDYVALLDTDMEVLEPYGDDDVDPASVAGVPVFKPNPPLDVWDRLLASRGASDFDKVRTANAGAGVSFTYRNNLNGGLYLVPVTLLHALGQHWRGIASDILSGAQNLFGAQRAFADQIAFALAMQQLGLTAKILEPKKNLPPELVAFSGAISAIHGMAKLNPLLYRPDGTHKWPVSPQSDRFAALDAIMRKVNDSAIGEPYHLYRKARLHAARGEESEALTAASMACERQLNADSYGEIAKLFLSYGKSEQALAAANKALDMATPAQRAALLAFRNQTR